MNEMIRAFDIHNPVLMMFTVTCFRYECHPLVVAVCHCRMMTSFLLLLYLAGICSSLLISSTEHGGCDLVVIVIWTVAHSITDDGNMSFLEDVSLSTYKRRGRDVVQQSKLNISNVFDQHMSS